jgi:DNA-binding LacI/PurR family transcriptional regulator
LADVAKKAGVSVMTVSNVVNGRVNLVREETRERVSRAISQLDYRPHVHARALRLARGWAVGMLFIAHEADFLALQWTSKLVAGLSNHLSEHGYSLLLHNQSPDALDSSILLKWARTDGLITMLSGQAKERKAMLEKLVRLNQPLIALQETISPRPGQDVAVVKQDDYGGGVKLATHLASLGAKKLVFVEG